MAALPSCHLPLHGPSALCTLFPPPPLFGVQGAGMKSLLLPATASAMWGPYQRAALPAAGMARAQRRFCQPQSRRRPGEVGMLRGVVDTPIFGGTPWGSSFFQGVQWAHICLQEHRLARIPAGECCLHPGRTPQQRSPAPAAPPLEPAAPRARCHARHGDLPRPPPPTSTAGR